MKLEYQKNFDEKIFNNYVKQSIFGNNEFSELHFNDCKITVLNRLSYEKTIRYVNKKNLENTPVLTLRNVDVSSGPVIYVRYYDSSESYIKSSYPCYYHSIIKPVTRRHSAIACIMEGNAT